MILPVNYDELHFTERRAVREEYARLQNGFCCHCGKSLIESASNEVMQKLINKRLFPETFFRWPIHLHHDHKIGMTIGAVHCHCNAVLWQYHGQ